MNEEQIAQVMAWLESGKDFVAEQSPMVVEDILVRPWVDLPIPLLLFSFFSWLVYKFFKFARKEVKIDPNEEGAAIIIGFIASAPPVSFGIIICSLIQDGLEAYFTPHLYVLEYLAGLAT